MPHPPIPPTSISGPSSGPLPPMMNGGGPHISQNTPLPPMNGGLNGGPPGGMMGAMGGPSPSGPSPNLATLPPMSSGSLPSMVS